MEPAPNNQNGNPSGSQPNNSEGKGQAPVTFDPSKVTEDQIAELTKSDAFWKVAFSHDRFKTLNEKAKKADEFESERQKQEEERLKSQKKYEELYETKGKEAADWKGRYETEIVNNKIFVEATKLGVVDPEAVIKLIDRAKIRVTNEGVEGIAETVKALVDSKPYLLNKQTVPNLGGPSNPPAGGQGQPRFTHSQIKDPKFFAENQAAIMQAMKLGLIVDDLK